MLLRRGWTNDGSVKGEVGCCGVTCASLAGIGKTNVRQPVKTAQHGSGDRSCAVIHGRTQCSPTLEDLGNRVNSIL